ncbi:PREDICTED: neuropeptide S [Myotis davidii]|nr:PREDICTED: neuropeptide S [Myotis davidii]
MGRDGISTPELSRYKRATAETRRRDSGSLKFNLVLVLSVSAMPVFWCYPAPSPKVSGTPDYALLLLGCCRARAGPGEGLDVRKPLLEEALAKRSFRNGVGTGLKKTPFPRAKS